MKTIPGRGTDWEEAPWLAMLARPGLLHAACVPPVTWRERRRAARQRLQLVGTLSGALNRVHKVPSDGGIRLSS